MNIKGYSLRYNETSQCLEAAYYGQPAEHIGPMDASWGKRIAKIFNLAQEQTHVWIVRAEVENEGLTLTAHPSEEDAARQLCSAWIVDCARNVRDNDAEDFPEDAETAKEFVELVEAGKYSEAWELYENSQTLNGVFPNYDEATYGIEALTLEPLDDEAIAPDRMTVTDAIDAFPTLRGVRAGIESTPDRAPRIADRNEFRITAAPHGGAANACANILCDLQNVQGLDLSDIAKLDSEHRAALAAVVSTWISQGGF